MITTTARQKEDDHDHDGEDEVSNKDNDKEDPANQDDRHYPAPSSHCSQGGEAVGMMETTTKRRQGRRPGRTTGRPGHQGPQQQKTARVRRMR